MAEMTGCLFYGSECSECDDAYGIPDCFTSRFKECQKHGTYDVDTGCVECQMESDAAEAMERD